MKKDHENTAKERMIHIRLDEQTHRKLKILVARTGTTIQSVVEDLIHRKVD